MSEGYQAPLYVAGEPQSGSDFLIYVGYHADSEPRFAKVEDILRRHGIDASAGYSRDGILVGAALDADQLAAIRRDPQVEYVERDCADRVARYFRHPGPDRIDGSYIVVGVDGTDAHRLVARHGVTSPTMLGILNGFGAGLSDEQRDRLRHEVEVVYVEDNQREYPAS